MLKAVLAAMAAVVLLLSAEAEATVITVDPGTVGQSFTTKVFDITELNGRPLDGATLSLDFVLGGKSIQANNNGTPLRFDVVLSFVHSGGGFITLPQVLSAFLSDQNGSSLWDATTTGANQSAGIQRVNSTYLAASVALTSVLFHDVHLAFVLPASAGETITSARLTLAKANATTFTVQEGLPRTTTIPEPATPLLFAFALVVLGLFGLAAAAAGKRAGSRAER